jgi:23S rRNA (adenine2503-C2)-methyltransferase
MAIKILSKERSKDESTKYTLTLEDGELIEAVHIPFIDETKVCISCQVGCPNKCKHCATGRDIEYVRDLTSYEIFEQVKVLSDNNNDDFRNYSILFMGMGEPFFNYDNLIKSFSLFNEVGIQNDRITVSTSGIIPQINEFLKLPKRPKLAISIHAADNKQRDSLVPINKVFGLFNLIETIKNYTKITGEEVIIQYTLIKGFNDTLRDINNMETILSEIKCELQIIPFNSFPTSSLKAPSKREVDLFCNQLSSRGFKLALKPSRGNDVFGGCGQLGCKK